MTSPKLYKPCRFCGEHDMLEYLPGYDERLVQNDDGSFVMEDGQPKTEVVDFISCDVCLASAPVDVWNGTWAHPPHHRAAYREYWLATQTAQVAK